MDSNEPDFIVVGEKVALGPLRVDLAPAYARWMNQLEVRRGLDHMGIATPQSQEKWVQENIEKGAKGEPDGVEFTIYDRGDATPVGTAGLFRISHAHGQAAFGIAIGERRGQGLGTEATRLVLDFAFHVLQLRNVLLETLEWNVAGLTAYERADFRRVGVRRGAVMSRGRPTDLVIMDAIPQDSAHQCCANAARLNVPPVARCRLGREATLLFVANDAQSVAPDRRTGEVAALLRQHHASARPLVAQG